MGRGKVSRLSLEQTSGLILKRIFKSTLKFDRFLVFKIMLNLTKKA